MKLPYKQVEHSDGSKTAPNWNNPLVDANLDMGRQANRSWEDSVRQMNPAGDPQHGRRMKADVSLPREKVAKVSFTPDGRKVVSYSDGFSEGAGPIGQQASMAFPTSSSAGYSRKKVVGPARNPISADPSEQPKNPNATTKPFYGKKVKAQDQGTFTPDEE